MNPRGSAATSAVHLGTLPSAMRCGWGTGCRRSATQVWMHGRNFANALCQEHAANLRQLLPKAQLRRWPERRNAIGVGCCRFSEPQGVSRQNSDGLLTTSWLAPAKVRRMTKTDQRYAEARGERRQGRPCA